MAWLIYTYIKNKLMNFFIRYKWIYESTYFEKYVGLMVIITLFNPSSTWALAWKCSKGAFILFYKRDCTKIIYEVFVKLFLVSTMVEPHTHTCFAVTTDLREVCKKPQVKLPSCKARPHLASCFICCSQTT